MQSRKVLQKLLDGSKNVRFTEMIHLANGFGFKLVRTSGSHHIFTREGIDELINIQNVNGEVKPYQARQFLRLIEKYNLKLEDS